MTRRGGLTCLRSASSLCCQLESDVDRVELSPLTFRLRRHFDGVVIYFFNSDSKFFDVASDFSVTSFMLFLFSLQS